MIAARFPRPDAPSRVEEIAPKGTEQGAQTLDRARGVPSARVEPLSPARYRIELTASKELRDKLEHARDLMRHRNPTGDLETLLDQALDLLVAKLEKERLCKTSRPKKSKPSTRRGYIARGVRRAVYARDGHQCTFVDTDGRRCPAHAFLELDHVVSRALGGADDVDNLRVRCRAHNALHAEHVFGREHVQEKIHLRQRKCIDTEAPAFDTAARGLRNMGFRDPDIRRALDVLRTKLDPSTSVEILVREALAILT